MSILHAYSQTVADGTATSVVRPSDWNSAHNMVLNMGGNTLGTSQISGSDIVWAGGNNVTLSANGSTVTIVGPNTVAQTVQTQASGNIAGAGFTSTTTAGTAVVATHNSAGLSMGVPAYLTTAAQSNHSHNFATTTTNGSLIVVGTTNSAGATIGVPAFITTYAAQTNQTIASGNIAGVGTTFAGTNVSGSMTLDSNGLNLALSAPAPGGGGAINVSAGTTSGNLQTIQFNNSNGVSFGLNGSTITASAAAGGGGATMSDWLPYQMALTSNTSVATGTVFFQPVMPPQNLSFNFVEIISSNAFSTFTGAYTRGITLSYGLYSENGSTLSLMSSSSVGMTFTQNSSTALGFSYTDGGGSFAIATANSTHSALNIYKAISLPFAGTLPAGGLFFWAQNMSTSSAGSNVPVTLSQLFNAELATNSNIGGWGGTFVNGTSRSIIQEPYGFIRSASSAGLPSSCAYTDMSVYSNYQPYLFFEA